MASLIATFVLPQTNNASSTNDVPHQGSIKLNATKPSNSFTAKLIVPGHSVPPALPSRSENIPAQEIRFKSDGGRQEHIAAVLRDPNTGTNYIVPALCDFYISNNSGLIWCQLSFGGEFMWHTGYFQMSDAAGGIDATIERFAAEPGAQELARVWEKVNRLSLATAAPWQFFTAHSAGGSQPGLATVKKVDVIDGIVHLDLLSDGGNYSGSFWIDLNAKKIIRSVVDGKEMDQGKGQGVPREKH